MNTKTIKEKKAKYELFHSTEDFFFTALDLARNMMKREIHQAFLDNKYESVKTFILPVNDINDQLETVFAKSQNIDKSWRGAKECRSTSVGDIVRVGNDYWIVASIGFMLGWQSNKRPTQSRLKTHRSLITTGRPKGYKG